MPEGRRACRGSVPALAVGLLSLAVALGIACHAVAQFSGGEELMEDSSGRGTAQRGAMAGARAAGRVLEPRVGQVLTRVEQDGSGHDGDKPLVTDKTVRQAMATIKGRNIRGMATAADKGKLQQLRYTGRYADTSYVVNAPEGDPATVTAHNSIWPSVVHRDQPYIEQVSSDTPPQTLVSALLHRAVQNNSHVTCLHPRPPTTLRSGRCCFRPPFKPARSRLAQIFCCRRDDMHRPFATL